MRCKHNLLFAVLLLLGCEKAATDLHDGEYVFTDSTNKHSLKKSIIIDGSYATLYIRSLFSSKPSKRKYMCIQYPDRIDIQVRKQPPFSIPVDKEGNLLWDEKRFERKPIHIIHGTVIPKGFMEEAE